MVRYGRLFLFWTEQPFFRLHQKYRPRGFLMRPCFLVVLVIALQAGDGRAMVLLWEGGRGGDGLHAPASQAERNHDLCQGRGRTTCAGRKHRGV